MPNARPIGESARMSEASGRLGGSFKLQLKVLLGNPVPRCYC